MTLNVRSKWELYRSTSKMLQMSDCKLVLFHGLCVHMHAHTYIHASYPRGPTLCTKFIFNMIYGVDLWFIVRIMVYNYRIMEVFKYLKCISRFRIFDPAWFMIIYTWSVYDIYKGIGPLDLILINMPGITYIFHSFQYYGSLVAYDHSQLDTQWHTK